MSQQYKTEEDRERHRASRRRWYERNAHILKLKRNLGVSLDEARALATTEGAVSAHER